MNQRGQVIIEKGRQVIVPQARFNCNGRIKNVAASMDIATFGTNRPLLQVWHPTSLTSTIYHKIGEVELPLGDFINGTSVTMNYYFANLSLSSSSQIEFQLGDAIGYYQPTDTQCLIYSIQATEYISYSNTVTSSITSIDINNVNNIETQRQPLIEVTFGKTIQWQTNLYVCAHIS